MCVPWEVWEHEEEEGMDIHSTPMMTMKTVTAHTKHVPGTGFFFLFNCHNNYIR